MTYRISPLSRKQFTPLFSMSEEELVSQNARQVTATSKPGFPCRVSLDDAEPGETLILLNHMSHAADTPYRSTYAIFVRENCVECPDYIDSVPPVFEGRPLALRGFNAEGMLKAALLALPGQADAKIREMFESDEIAYAHAHNAAHGCFAAQVDRD